MFVALYAYLSRALIGLLLRILSCRIPYVTASGCMRLFVLPNGSFIRILWGVLINSKHVLYFLQNNILV
ncbi:hypothetical protein EUGRSUZ_F02639 [Eucalyptus grandis]|uniref:Uncharacterized protein n=2 Tax=Eucalyptus grandis TaxID=71139 RepID=A0ACC3KKM8_EUCGR|nr:hypothetical protein EUGRSUZ_F02639 [Eucalyptus grandis]